MGGKWVQNENKLRTLIGEMNYTKKREDKDKFITIITVTILSLK